MKGKAQIIKLSIAQSLSQDDTDVTESIVAITLRKLWNVVNKAYTPSNLTHTTILSIIFLTVSQSVDKAISRNVVLSIRSISACETKKNEKTNINYAFGRYFTKQINRVLYLYLYICIAYTYTLYRINPSFYITRNLSNITMDK